ncbi:MAG: hypothetical protein WEC84_04545 [Candidatus Andersenbacteria bacterium]
MEKSFNSFGELKGYWDKREENKKEEPTTEGGKQPEQAEQELSPEVIEKIMEKMKDFSDPETRRLTACHALETTGSAPAPATPASVPLGVVHTERILERGLIPKRLADRIGVKRSSSGYDPTGLFTKRDTYQKSVFVSELEGLSRVNDEGKPLLPQGGYYFLLNPVNPWDIQPEGEYYVSGVGSNREGGRVPPKKIVGIVVESKTLNRDVEEIFTDYAPNVYDDLKHVVLDDLGLQVSPEEARLLTKYEQANEEIAKQVHEADQALKDQAKMSGRDRLTDEELDESYSLRNRATAEQKKNYTEAIKVLLATLRKHDKYKDVTTLGDYLRKISVKYETPVYNEYGDLEYPRHITQEGVRKMVGEREAKKSKHDQKE